MADYSQYGGGGGGGGSNDAVSSASASNVFGAVKGLDQNTLALIGLALVTLFAIVLATRK